MQDTIDLEGILEKKGPNAMQSYKKRKCILSVPGKYLRYYDDHTFKSEINLRTMVDVQLADTENPGEIPLLPTTAPSPTSLPHHPPPHILHYGGCAAG